MMAVREWRLRSFLVILLVVTTLVTLAIVGTLILMLRIPHLERESRLAVRNEATQLAARVEIILGSLESRLVLLAASESLVARSDLPRLLDGAVRETKEFKAVYLVSAEGNVLAAGPGPEVRGRREEILGYDLSANSLFRDVLQRRKATWSDKYLSALSGTQTLGLAVPVGGNVLLAEVPLTYLLETVRLAASQGSQAIWVVDRLGELVVDIGGANTGAINLLDMPLLKAAQSREAGEDVAADFTFGGRSYHAGVTRSQALDWVFVARAPAGIGNPAVQMTVAIIVLGFIGAMVIGILLAPWWSLWLVRPLLAIVRQARRVAAGEVTAAWPRGAIREFNDLSADLESMSRAIGEREKKFLSIFNTSPAPMVVSDVDNDFTMLDINEAWCRQFGRERESVVGRKRGQLNLWQSPEDREAIMTSAVAEDYSGEAWMLHGSGRPMLCRVSARMNIIGKQRLMIWAMEDITEWRNMLLELRQLNADLESRVVQRTSALAAANAELSATVENLRRAQNDLVRAEKMAALGGLVAGVAHELNTPIGNGLMSVSTLNERGREFRELMLGGLRRSALEEFLIDVEQATNLASRNLHRAADLVNSFKQVAVDQSSAQRRPFELKEVVEEIVMTLRPSLSRTAYEVTVDVPDGLQLDSYPGPLGQALANLINNAVLHGFEGRDHGVVALSAERSADEQIVLRVADDGKGIAPALIGRIFEPFVTTRLGSGGTGLGLHIAYNAVTNVLGGALTVHSREGEGTCFELRLPQCAPHISPDQVKGFPTLL